MERLLALHRTYNAIRAALPWLDCYVCDWPCAFADGNVKLPTPARQLDFTTTNPRLVRQTEHSFEEIEAMAVAHPEISYIIASGDRKMLYHFAALETVLKKHANLYLATTNVCNEFALERLIAAGLKDKLLYGSMMPFLGAGNTLAQIILGKFDWQTKCAIAGNNFRRLLGEPEVSVPEIKIPDIRPFLVDSHAHTLNAGGACRFPPYKADSIWSLWQEKMDPLWVEDIFITPSEPLHNVMQATAQSVITSMCREAKGRVRYYEVFDPLHIQESVAALEQSLPDPYCIGIKIHPSVCQVYASDPRYDQAFALASRFGKCIMSHTWGISDYNPTQKFATPKLFAPHLEKYPGVKFVIGHCGGRPNGLPEAVEICRRFPQVHCDFAGDIFFNGHVEHAISDIGPDRLLFASDSYWIDQRCMLGMFLETELTDAQLWGVFRENALKFFAPAPL